MTRVISRRLSWIALALAIGAVVAVLSFQHRAIGAPPPPSAMTGGFQDRSNGAYLRIQLDSSAPDYGAFVVALPHVGLIWPPSPATVSPVSSHSTQLRYDAAGFLQAEAQLDTEFGVNYQPAGPVQDIALRVIGQVDPDHKTGSIELWVNGTHYHLGVLDTPHTADLTVSAYLAAVSASDWAGLYAITDSSAKNSLTESDFVQTMSAAAAGQTFANGQASGAIDYTISAAGVGYATVSFRLTVIENGNSSTQAGKLVLIFDGGQWRVLSVDLPS